MNFMRMNCKRFALFGFALLMAFQAEAYIPSSKFILSRLAKNGGRGAFQVEQEIQFRTETEPIVLRERWTVESGDSLRLSLIATKGASENFRYEALYKDGRRYVLDTDGNVKTSNQTSEFFEPYLYFRSTKGFTDALARQKVLPANLAPYRKQVKSFNNVVYPLESYTRLSRTGGVITYAFGLPTPPNSNRPNAGIWIEQDSFLLRRLRYPTRTEVEADNHIFASSGLRIPRDRDVTWETSSATIKILSVKSIPPAQAAKSLSVASLGAGKANATKLPDATAVADFYSRFR